MKLTLLVDNNTYIDKYLFAEPAVSFYIETGNKKILFDCGYSDVFIKNAVRLAIDLNTLDYAVLSHNHQDHTWGLNDLVRFYNDIISTGQHVSFPELIAHPEIFKSTFIEGLGEIGVLLSKNKLENFFRLNLSAKPLELDENLFFLGEIPRNNDFENLYPIGINKKTGKPDFMIDDSALAYKMEKGIVIITACSHAGICNICEYAKEVCGDNRITDIIGGLHLLNPLRKQMQGTLEYIKKLNLNSLYACHCTDLYSKIKLASIAPLKEAGSGLIINF